ncbi:MAG: endonuclease domain-containing protein [Proteobacteria bacterium]|nr:endonuclease domain-containing protein [Pseudomonadota bacterium]
MRARLLRKSQTEAEKILWLKIRNRNLNGHKFFRQYIIGFYIVDFVCFEKKLIIELDGSQHLVQVAYDQERSKELNSIGFRVIRFWNDEVLTKIDLVLNEILEALTFHSP